ncbi:MAG TPA: hypothetical protein VFX03_11895, partial [Thermomicrobiales bacterium]|nr:hypothetical protein [Thermomicrobiales bacterium]
MLPTLTRRVVGLGMLAGFARPAVALADYAPTAPAAGAAITAKQVAFQDAMRKLWEDHITWTRLFIVDFAAGSPETEATTRRLLQNQVDIGDAVAPYYGAAAGGELTDLLKQHILQAGDVLAAAKAGDAAKLDAASKRWYANANDIAAFLHGANPEAWPLAAMQAMMKSHLDDTTAEAAAHLEGDWAADIAAYDKVHAQILGMA